MLGLPPELSNAETRAMLMKAGRQWSQIAAWSWLKILAYQGESDKADKEEKLKEFFCDIIQDQAKNIHSATVYGDESSIERARDLTKTIKSLLIGETPIPRLPNNDLTLSKVLCKLVDPELDPDGKDPDIGFITTTQADLFKPFSYEVVIDRSPHLIRKFDSETDPILKSIHGEDTKYIVPLPYPPCPPLGEATFEDKQLENWMRGESDDYLPPSAYMVLGTF